MANTGGKCWFIKPICFDSGNVDVGNLLSVVVGGTNVTSVGENLVTNGVSNVVNMGSSSSVGAPAGGSFGVVIGHSMAIPQVDHNVFIGYGITSTFGITNTMAVGVTATMGAGCISGVLYGGSLSAGAGDFTPVMIGNTLTIGGGAAYCVALGIGNAGDNTINGGGTCNVFVGRSSGGVAIGNGSFMTNIGCDNLLASGSSEVVVCGHSCLAGAGINKIVIMGSAVSILAGTTVTTAIGTNLSVNSSGSFVGGDNIVTGNSFGLIALGVGSGVGPHVGASGSGGIAIGSLGTVSGMALGNSFNTVTNVGFETVVGDNCQSTTTIGNRSTISNGANAVQLLGDSCGVGANCSVVSVFGNVITVGASSVHSHFVGDNIAAGTNLSEVVVISCNATGSLTVANGASNVVAIGPRNVIGAFTAQIAIGSANTITGVDGIAVGFGCSVADAAIGVGLAAQANTSSIAIGGNTHALGTQDTIVGTGSIAPFTLGTEIGRTLVGYGSAANTSYSIVVGYGSTDVSGSTNVIVGRASTATGTCIVIGHDNAGNGTEVVCIGGQGVVTGNYAIGMGYHVSNTTANTMIIGRNNLTAGAYAIHSFEVQGYNGVDLSTIKAFDNPASSGDVGLTITYNTGASVVNRQVKAAVAPTGGSLLLYISP